MFALATIPFLLTLSALNWVAILIPLLLIAVRCVLLGLWRMVKKGDQPVSDAPFRDRTCLWLGSILAVAGAVLFTILAIWDLPFDMPNLMFGLQKGPLLIASVLLMIHGGLEAKRGWANYLYNWLPSWMKGNPADAPTADACPQAPLTNQESYHRHMLLQNTLLMVGALLMLTVIGGLIKSEGLVFDGPVSKQESGQFANESELDTGVEVVPNPDVLATATGGASDAQGEVAKAKELTQEEQEKRDKAFALSLARLLVIGASNAVLGALFYSSQRYREKEAIIVANFSANIFWSALWYRIGEAAVITMAVFFFLVYFGDLAPAADGSLPWNVATLPLIGLLLGTRIEQAEKLIREFARRTIGLFHMALTGQNSKQAGDDVPVETATELNPTAGEPIGAALQAKKISTALRERNRRA